MSDWRPIASREDRRMTLRDLIDKARALKRGDKEFALFALNDAWEAWLGNPSRYVMLGEIEGEFMGKGATPEEAVADLLAKVEEAQSKTLPVDLYDGAKGRP